MGITPLLSSYIESLPVQGELVAYSAHANNARTALPDTSVCADRHYFGHEHIVVGLPGIQALLRFVVGREAHQRVAPSPPHKLSLPT